MLQQSRLVLCVTFDHASVPVSSVHCGTGVVLHVAVFLTSQQMLQPESALSEKFKPWDVLNFSTLLSLTHIRFLI